MGRHASLNHVYRLVWSHALNTWIAVAETTRGRGKKTSRKLIAAALALCTGPALALPTGGQVTAGSGTITQSGTTTTINQGSQNLSLSWQGFNTAADETVNFKQPSAAAIAVNRIHDTNGTQFYGHLNANGQVWLINPNGILFGKSAQVNVGGLVASTLDIADGSTFAGNGTGSVVNGGTINAQHYVALLGDSVTNQGVITAQLGTVALGAGNQVSLTFSGNNLVKLTVDKSVLDSLAANHGLIQTDGGTVIMTAGAKDSLLASVVNNDGIVEARTVSDRKGTITLLDGMAAGTVNVGGTLDASAPNGGNGGFIETSGHNVHVTSHATITTEAANGSNGTWLLDPYDFTIAASGGDITGTALGNLLASNNVKIQTTAGTNNSSNLYGTMGSNGDINVNDTVSWSTNTLNLSASRNININAPMNATGMAKLLLHYGQGSTNGSIGGITANYYVNAPVNLATTASFRTKLGSSGTPVVWTIIDSLGGSNDATTAPGTMTLQGMAAASSLSGHYVLGKDIVATATSSWNGGSGFTPIGNVTTNFTGAFNGLGHTISNLYINRSGTHVGLFGIVNGTAVSDIGLVRDVGLVGGSVKGGGAGGELVGSNSNGTISNAYATGSVSGGDSNGGLVGFNQGTISDAYATGSVNGGVRVGGLVGNNGGTINDAYATGTVSGSSDVGGLVGSNSGAINNAYATGSATGSGNDIGGLVGLNYNSATISDAYATGSVSGSNDVGGLVGLNYFLTTISNVYATGSVNGSSDVGGLVGFNLGAVSNAYAAGSVSGSGLNVGGLVGLNSNGAGTISNGYWDTTTDTAASAGVGNSNNPNVSGLSTAALSSNLPSGFSNSVWGNIGNQMTPYLLANANFGTVSGSVYLGSDTSAAPTAYGLILNMTQLQEINSTGLSDNYVLGTNLDASVTSTWNSNGSGVYYGFAPIGGSKVSNEFVGVFDGLGHTISNLYINRPSGFIGLFGGVGTGGTVRNVGLVGGSVSGTSWVGDLVGFLNTGGTVTAAYASGSVSGGTGVGGLVGHNQGTISDAYATGTVTGTSINAGGLVGTNVGLVSNAYASGDVSGKTNVGGLAGYNSSGRLMYVYASGSVSGSNSFVVGGLAGSNSNGARASNGAWDTTTCNCIHGVNNGVTGYATNVTGLTTAQMQHQYYFTSYAASNGLASLLFDFTNTWTMYDGYTMPLLRAFPIPPQPGTTGTSDASGTNQSVVSVRTTDESLADQASNRTHEGQLVIDSGPSPSASGDSGDTNEGASGYRYVGEDQHGGGGASNTTLYLKIEDGGIRLPVDMLGS